MSWYLLAAIPVFAVIVLVHEFGHFITAKWAGIRVDEFGIGFPPRAIGIKRGETIYSINWLPLGGFVRMPGENGDATDENGVIDPRSFAAKPASKRLVVLLAGVTMNLILAVVLFSAAHAIGQVDYPATISQVLPGSPAAQAGMRPGDHIISVNGQKVSDWSSFVSDVAVAANKAPASSATVPVGLVVQHAGSHQSVPLTVNALIHPGPNQGHIGVKLDDSHPFYIRTPLWQAPIAGVQEVGATIGAIGTAFQQIFRGTLSPADAFQGPVGIVQDSGQAASAIPQFGWSPVIWLTGALSVSLAIVNVLPIPALDGGRVLLILIEIARRGKRLSPEREGLITLAGFGVLISLMLVVTYFDVSRIFAH
jgi:regulator of sigma E protease